MGLQLGTRRRASVQILCTIAIHMNKTEFHGVKLETDELADRKRMSRTAFMRMSRNRNLAYFLDTESKGLVHEESDR